MITIIKTSLLLLLACYSLNTTANEQYQKVEVADPYIDVRTGHGEGYPIYHVIERGEIVEIIVRHTSWYQVRDKDGKTGWVAEEQMEMTLAPGTKDKIEISAVTHEDYVERHWEVGILGGNFSRAETLTVYGAYLFNKSMAGEFSFSDVLGKSSSSQLFKLGLVMQPFPTLEYSPYVTLGVGVIQTKPNSTIIQPDDTSNQLAIFGLGVRTYLTKRIILRLEYSDNVIFSASNTNSRNEEIKEWKAGFAVFF